MQMYLFVENVMKDFRLMPAILEHLFLLHRSRIADTSRHDRMSAVIA
jgi:hypothetical protein